MPAHRVSMIAAMTMTRLMRQLALGLLAAPLLLAPPVEAAAKRTEAEIQAAIDAEIAAAAEAQKAAIAARQAQAAEDAAARAAQTPPAPTPALEAPPVPARTYETVPVILTTSMGSITIAVEVERAPITAANFLRYVDQKRLDGTQFYRAFTFDDFPDVGMIQGGTQNDPKRILKPVHHEPTSKTGLTHDDGAVSLARNELGSGTADFFIIMGGMPGLDAGSGQNGPDDQGFAVFGHVTEGMDIVRRIAVAPRSPTKGEGAMKGQMLEPTIRILTARRAPAP